MICLQFSSVAQLCPTLYNPMNCSTPGLPVHHQLPEFIQTHVPQVSDAIQPSHPRSSPTPSAPNPSQHQSLFQWVNSSHEVAKVLGVSALFGGCLFEVHLIWDLLCFLNLGICFLLQVREIFNHNFFKYTLDPLFCFSACNASVGTLKCYFRALLGCFHFFFLSVLLIGCIIFFCLLASLCILLYYFICYLFLLLCLLQWHPIPVLLPGKSHGQRSLVGCSPWGHWGLDTTERLHFHFSLSCTGEGNDSPLQCSCLENPRDGGAWWAAVYGVTQSRTWLKWLSSSSSLVDYCYF